VSRPWFEPDAIAACFIDGTAVTAGIGRVSGAVVGASVAPGRCRACRP